MPRALHIAAAQIHSGGPRRAALERIDRQAAAAALLGAELILFAECALHGYDYDMTPRSVRRLAEPVDGPHVRQLARIARRRHIILAVGFFERAGAAIHNSVLVARPAGALTVARKHNLTAGELRAQLTPGPKRPTIITVNNVRLAIIICADGGVPGLHSFLQRERVDYRLCPTGGGGKLAEMLHERALLTVAGRRRYVANRPRVFNTAAILDRKECPHTGFTSANALGPVGKQTCHQGHCMIVDNDRVMRAQIPGTIVLEHQQDQLIHAQLRFP